MKIRYNRPSPINYFVLRLCKRRNGYFYAHVTIPHVIRPILKRTQIKKSLRTKDLDQALVLKGGIESSIKYFLNNVYNNPNALPWAEESRFYLKDIAADLAFIRKELKSQNSS